MRERFDQALKEALREKDPRAVSTIRLILAALKDREISAREQHQTLTEEDVLKLLQSMVKQRRESIRMYEEGGRLELADQERAEIAIIERFLPPQLSEYEIIQVVNEVIAELDADCLKDMGRVMTELRGRFAGQMDFAKASAVCKQQLG